MTSSGQSSTLATATSASGAVTLWKRPLFSNTPSPEPERKLEAARRRLSRLLVRSNNNSSSEWDVAVMEEVQTQLDSNYFVLLDQFVGRSRGGSYGWMSELKREIKTLLPISTPTKGRVGSTGSGASAMALRSDVAVWVQAGGQSRAIDALTHRVDGLVASLRRHGRLDELSGTTYRSDAMVAMYPPNGSHYVRHFDNICSGGHGKRCNGRRLTAVYYLGNGKDAEEAARVEEGFEPGALRIFWPGPPDSDARVDVSPAPDRLCIFWSDERVPHAVLPTKRSTRLAITHWFFDVDERERAERIE